MKNNTGKNLLILFSDQHSRHMLGCYGNGVVKTPNLDRLAAEGTRFSNAYTPCPVCVPARAAMAIGDYASKHGYYDNALAYDGKVESWGARLCRGGVDVVTVGKLHFKSDDPATGFPDQRIPLHIKDGVGDIYGEIRNKTITRPQFRKALEDARAGESDYSRFDREVALRAADYLKNEAGKDGRPFALLAGFVSPHFPLIAPQKYVDMYPEGSIPVPTAFTSEKWAHHPVIDDYRRYCCQEDLPDFVKMNAIRVYYALCSFLDDQIGIVLSALKESGLDKDTTVIYTSDHGDMMGEHGLFFKSTMYEGSVGVPMIIAGPSVPAGCICDTPASLVDIYPTAEDCCGLGHEGTGLPGKSLLDMLSEPYDGERSVYSEYMSFGCYTAEYMLRKGDYKYIHYVGETPQLFNIKEDPDEMHNLSRDEHYADVLASLEKELRSIMDLEGTEDSARKAQKALLDERGGEEEFLKSFKPVLFSPIPDLSK